MTKISKTLFFLCVVLSFISCSDKNVLPKPKAQLSLRYPKPVYKLLKSSCNFSFEVSQSTQIKSSKKCWLTLKYPLLNASITITYKPIKNDLKALLQDAEKLTYSHAIKADEITNQPYINKKKHVYATLYKVTGNAASQIQFHATDSVQHFLTGALYFNASPNYDSIYPAVNYLETEIIHIIETLSWD